MRAVAATAAAYVLLQLHGCATCPDKYTNDRCVDDVLFGSKAIADPTEKTAFCRSYQRDLLEGCFQRECCERTCTEVLSVPIVVDTGPNDVLPNGGKVELFNCAANVPVKVDTARYVEKLNQNFCPDGAKLADPCSRSGVFRVLLELIWLHGWMLSAHD
jgi:hypothetical protein